VLLTYSEDRDTRKPLLELPTGATWELWTAPMSLRDVEPNVNLVIDERDDSLAFEGGWTSGPDQPVLPTIDQDVEPSTNDGAGADGRS
jgi:hypothetical protein